MAAVSSGTGGCKSASPAPVLAAAVHSHARLGPPASSVEDALPQSRLTPCVIALAPFFCSIESPWRVRGAAACLLCRGSGGRRDTRAVHTLEGPRIPHQHPRSWAHCSARGSDGDTSLPRAETGGRTVTLSRDCRRGKRAGRRRAARGGGTRPPPPPKILDRPRRRRDGGREWKPGRGGDRRGHAQEMQEPKIFHHCSRPPPPSSAVRQAPPAARRGGAGAGGMRCGAFRAAPGRTGAAAHLLPRERRLK